MPAVLRCDPGRLRQILLNLTSNAVKFTVEGHVALRAEVVRTAAHPVDGDHVRVRLSVTDSGIGIDIEPEMHAALFDSFSQADASTTRRFGGTGLGLAISRRLVAAMGGAIDLESTPGRGSRFGFELTLPARDVPPSRPFRGAAPCRGDRSDRSHQQRPLRIGDRRRRPGVRTPTVVGSGEPRPRRRPGGRSVRHRRSPRRTRRSAPRRPARRRPRRRLGPPPCARGLLRPRRPRPPPGDPRGAVRR